VTGNFADADEVGGGAGGGIAFDGGGSFNFKNSIIAGNTDILPGPVAADGDCAGIVTSQGPNLMQGYDGSRCTVNGAPVLLGGPLLGPLANNGGATKTHALLAGSPALDAGEPGNCTDALGAPILIDQRGFGRPAFGGLSVRCDLGAYEFIRPLCLQLLRR
jgi:hypothetical protein